MRIQSLGKVAFMAIVLGSAGCARNSDSDVAGAPRDTTRSTTDSVTANQTESGMTDSTGRSTLGPDADKIRPDQGQPVTSKGDTVSAGADSSSTAP